MHTWEEKQNMCCFKNEELYVRATSSSKFLEAPSPLNATHPPFSDVICSQIVGFIVPLLFFAVQSHADVFLSSIFFCFACFSPSCKRKYALPIFWDMPFAFSVMLLSFLHDAGAVLSVSSLCTIAGVGVHHPWGIPPSKGMWWCPCLLLERCLRAHPSHHLLAQLC